jgi:hypothetical protein
MPKRVVDDDAPRPTNFPENVLAFPELENFLSQDPDDAKQTSWTAIRDENDLNYIGDAKKNGVNTDSDPENRWKDEDANKSLDMIVPLDKDRDDSMEFDDDLSDPNKVT